MASAWRRAVARWLSACHTLLRFILGLPHIRASGHISSTITGSAMKAAQLSSSAARAAAMWHPKLHTCWRSAVRVSWSICSFTRYTPAGMGCVSPPRPTMASNSKGIPSSSRVCTILLWRNGSWSKLVGYCCNSSAVWRMLRSNTGRSSLYTATLVEVEPGLMTRMRMV